MEIKITVNGDESKKELGEKVIKAMQKATMTAMERIKTFEDACEDQGREPEYVLPYEPDTTDPEEINENAYVKLKTIIKSLNEGWSPDFSDSNQYKYYPWFRSNGSGLGLSFGDYDYAASGSPVGSRLYLKSRELAEYAGKQFIEIYNQYNN